MVGRHRTLSAWIAPLVAAGLLVAALASQPPGRSVAVASVAERPNVVFILADDLSWNLINRRFTPNVVRLEKRGETFTNYFVADSLCCPSRATIFTGLFPHDTKVRTNRPPQGGFQKFQSQGLDRRTFAVSLHRRGYLTSMLGKYLNGYGDPVMTSITAPIPPGWTDWHVGNHTGYPEFNYFVNDNGRYDFYGGSSGPGGNPANYGVDVLNADARSFINGAGKRPFLLEVATFAPHRPYTPAPRNAADFPGLEEPRDPSFDRNNVHPPAWLGKRKALTPTQVATIDQSYRLRAQAVESVDKLLHDVEATLAARHLLRNTYIVFSSDNGYHLGQHRLAGGKKTAFDSDIRVPLIVAGPGVPPGRTVPQVVQNVDLNPTFVALAHGAAQQPVDGHSLLPLLHPPTVTPPWRTVALAEHTGQNNDPTDPDFEGGRLGGNPTTYEAIRLEGTRLKRFRRPVNAVYVEYRDAANELEYYDLRSDPYERHNIAGHLSAAQRAELHRILIHLERCHNAKACWAAAMPQ